MHGRSASGSVERELYRPEDDWFDSEMKVVEELQERDQDILANGLEPEPEGVNDLLVNDEFDPAENQAAFDLGQQLTEATTSVRI